MRSRSSRISRTRRRRCALPQKSLPQARARAGSRQGGQRGGGNRGGQFRVFFGCLTLHIAQPDEVTARKLYTPISSLFGAPQLTFMPSVGLYAVARQPQAGQESFRVYTLPSTPPKDPFEVRAATECTADLKNTATEALTELRAYFASGSGAASLDDRRAHRKERHVV